MVTSSPRVRYSAFQRTRYIDVGTRSTTEAGRADKLQTQVHLRNQPSSFQSAGSTDPSSSSISKRLLLSLLVSVAMLRKTSTGADQSQGDSTAWVSTWVSLSCDMSWPSS